ncbi:MAG: autotransporter-associated beta strand repeat-containing protein [Verrucomicrobiota bacterium]
MGPASSLLGAALYWDTDKNTTGLQAGNGDWNSSNQANANRKWNEAIGGDGADHAWTSDSDAYFETSGPSVVTLTSVIFVNSITFNGTGYTIAGPTSGVEVLTLTGAGTITVNADATISARLGGTVGLKKLGAATLTLSGANIYTGLTDVQAGTLALGASNVFADASTLKVSGGILSLVANNDTVAGVQLTAGSITGSGTLTSTTAFDLQAGSVSAILGGSVGANKTTAGTVTLSGANTYTGLTDVQVGTLALGASNVFADASTLKISGGILSLGANSDTVAGVQLTGGSITGSGTLTSTTAFDLQAGSVSAILAGSAGANKTTAGTVTLSGANTYTGLTTVTAGTLGYGVSDAISTGAVTVNGGTLALSTFSDTVGAVTLSSGSITGSTGVLTGTSYNVTNTGSVSAILAGSAVTLTKTGAGTATLSGANTYTGITSINDGTLIVNGNQSSANGAVTVANIAKLFGTGTIGGATTIHGTQSSGASAGAVGNQNFSSSLTYKTGSIFEWDLNANSIASGFDTLSAVGNISVETGSVFKVVFGTGVDLANAFWSTPNTTQTWSMASIFGKAFSSGSFTSVVSTANPTTQGSFTLTGGGTTLTWTAVPEPTSALAGILLGAGLLRRKRNQRQSA